MSAGRRALKEAESRLPADLRRQLDRRLKDADKTARAAIKQLQTQVKRASTRADVNSVLKRIDGLTKQARQIARGAGSRTATTRRAARPRRTASRTRKAAASTRRRAAAQPEAPPAAATTARPRRRAPRRRAAPAMVEAPMMPMTPEPEPMEVGTER